MPDNDLGKLTIEKKSASLTQSGRRRKRMIVWSILILTGVSIMVAVLMNPVITVESVAVSLVYPSQSFTLLNASGYVVAQKKASVAPKTTGQLEWLGVEEGSRVKAGQLLARLENRDVSALRDQAVASVSSARANFDQSKAELVDAGKAFARARELFGSGVLSKAEFDTAEARLNRATAAVSGMNSAIKVAEAALSAANASLDYTMIKAPFDGVVLTKNADVGDIVTPIGAAANAKAAVVTIADPASVQVEADVSESNLAKVKVGDPCEIQLDALPDVRFRGLLHTIVPTADRSKASVMVKVRFLDTDPRILPEMSAKVAFLQRAVSLNEKKPRTAVPRESVTERSGRKVVFVLTGDVVKETAVSIGEILGDFVEIRDGVKAGQVIVNRPSQKLENGSRTKPADRK